MRASQTVLPFKLTASNESLTAHAGLVLFDEYLGAMGIAGLINHELPGAGSAAGYDPSAHVAPLVLMLAGGGRTLEDLRILRRDDGLRCVVGLDDMPSSDACGDWMRRMGANESGGLAGLQRVNRCVFRRLLRADERTDFTLDIDATQIVAEKREARYSYKGEKGYMPMVGHIAENSLVIDHEFREGNAAPAARNLEFVQACERKMPKGRRIKAVRADSAAYQADVFNYCEETHKIFAIGADQDAAVKAVIAAIPEGEWKAFRDGEIAETVHCMNKTDKAFRLIVLRRPREQDLFEDKSLYRYHAIASNRGRFGQCNGWLVPPSTGSAGDFWDFRGFQAQIRRWRLIVRLPKSTTSARDHDVSGMAPPSRMMRAHRSRMAANMSNMAAPICKKICRPWRTILPAV